MEAYIGGIVVLAIAAYLLHKHLSDKKATGSSSGRSGGSGDGGRMNKK